MPTPVCPAIADGGPFVLFKQLQLAAFPKIELERMPMSLPDVEAPGGRAFFLPEEALDLAVWEAQQDWLARRVAAPMQQLLAINRLTRHIPKKVRTGL